MHLDGSCACGAVTFSLESAQPVPYQRCYCSICRKAGGGGGYSINLGGDFSTLQVRGREHVRIFRAPIANDAGVREPSEHERHFCSLCGSHLWAYNPQWPELVHPVAGAIDTALPAPPEHVHMMVGSKAAFVAIEGTPKDARFEEYPKLSLANWHAQHKL